MLNILINGSIVSSWDIFNPVEGFDKPAIVTYWTSRKGATLFEF